MKKILVGTSLLLLTACSTPLEYDHSVFSIGEDVELTYIDSVSSVRDRDGQFSVQVRGASPETQTVYYKTEWFDQNGMKMASGLTRWKPVKLIKDIEFTWNMTAPSKRAAGYKVYIVDELDNGLIR